MTRRRLIKALAALPFVGGLLRQRLDVVDVVDGAAPTPIVFRAGDIVMSIELDPIRSPGESTTIDTLKSDVHHAYRIY